MTQAVAAPRPGLHLQPGTSFGAYSSPILRSPFAATHAVLSVNLRDAEIEETGVVGFVAWSADGELWCARYRMFEWGLPGSIAGARADSHGRVETDTLHLDQPTFLWRYRIAWRSEDAIAAIRRVALVVSTGAALTDSSDPNQTAWGQRLDVPFLSQWNMEGHNPERVCSPVCVTMVCRFWGRDVSMPDIAAHAYDELCDLYGNWSLNTLAASLLKLKAVVDRGESIRYLEDEVVAGRPVITSISYGEGELHDAPVSASKGHLVVVAGFSDKGDPIVRDPAARGDDPWLTYRRAEFARAWLGHGGVVYRIEPEAA